MLKKNNFISISKFYEFGASKKTVCKVYKKAGINPRYCNLYLKNTVVLKVKKVLENYLVGRNLKKRNYQLRSFSNQLRSI